MLRICPCSIRVNEGVLQAARDLPPFVGLLSERRDRALERGGVVAADVQRLPKATACCTPGVCAAVRPVRQIGTTDGPGG